MRCPEQQFLRAVQTATKLFGRTFDFGTEAINQPMQLREFSQCSIDIEKLWVSLENPYAIAGAWGNHHRCWRQRDFLFRFLFRAKNEHPHQGRESGYYF